MVCGQRLIRAQYYLLSSSLHANMHNLYLLAWHVDKFISLDSSLSDVLFHRTNLSMKRYGEVVATRLSDFLYDNWWRSIRWSETLCLPDAMPPWRHTIRIYSHRVCIAGLFKIFRIASGITQFLSATVSVISYSVEIIFITDKSSGLWHTCVINTDTDNM